MSKFDRYLENLWNNYTKDLANILIVTGVTGWALSSAGQIVGLLANDKISNKEKTFLIPQEVFDAGVNIASFLLITTGIKKFANKLVTTGKVAPKSLREYYETTPFKSFVGTDKFNAERDLNGLASFTPHKKTYDGFKNIVTTGATIGGSIFSCNIVTPLLRNNLASVSHNSIVKSAHAGKNNIISKEELDSKKSNLPQLKPYSNFSPKYNGALKI